MIKAVASYVFFFFLVFAILGIVVSEVSQTFSQLFFLLCKDGFAYDLIANIIIFLVVFSAISYLIISNMKNKGDFVKSFIASFIAFLFLFVWVFVVSAPDEDFINTLHFNSYELVYLDFFALLEVNYFEILLSSFVYCFFILCPLGFLALNWHFNAQKSLHLVAHKFFPSINVCILFIIANAIQPYYDKANFYLYVDLFAFLLSLLLLLIVFVKKKYLFRFYEYANLLFLIIVIFIVLYCSSVLARADYYNVRYCFYLLAFLSWCCEWMFEDFVKE